MSYAVLLKHLQGQHDQHSHAHGSAAITAPTAGVAANQLANFYKGLPSPDMGTILPDVPHWSSDAQIKVKMDTLRKISEDTGLTANQIGDVMNKWADTSNDSDMKSLSIQQAAADTFDTELSDYQKYRINVVKSNPKYSHEIMLEGDFHPYKTPKDAVAAVLKSMHAETQKQFKESGVESVVLYRGVTSTVPDSGTFNLKSNALESWTFSPVVASNFGTHVIKARVPANRVLSTARTGLGVLNELEVVIIGNKPGDVAQVVDSSTTQQSGRRYDSGRIDSPING